MTARGNEQKNIFRDNQDSDRFFTSEEVCKHASES